MMNNLIHFTVVFIAVLISATGGEEVYAQVGETVSLPTGFSIQKHYVYWYFGSSGSSALAWYNPYGQWTFTEDKRWKSWLTASEKSLTIKDFQEDFFGTFICEVKSSGQPVSTTVYKVFKFNVSMDPASPLLPEEDLSLACNLGIPPTQNKPQIHWLNPRAEKVKTNQASFKIGATTQDNGKWTCVVTNNRKEYKASVSVTVLELSPVPSRLYTSSNTRLTVPCSFPSYISWAQIKQRGIKEVQWQFSPKSSSGPSPYQELYSLSLENSMQWEKKQDKGLNPVTGQGLEKGNLSLTRNRGRGEDEGDYSCLMKFKNGVILNSTVHVEVLQIFSSPGTELISGQQVSLSCTTGNPLPSDEQLKWFPPEKLSPPIPDLHRANFTIEEVGTGHSGKWKCELWQSETLLTSAVITLKIEPKLSVWMLVIICSAAVIILLLIVLAVILCRRRQRKMRRPRFCQCKNPKGFYKT